MGVDDHKIDTKLIVAFLSSGSVGHGDHEGGALLPGRIVLIALEEAARERIGIIAEKKEFHPGVGDDVVMILENDVCSRAVRREVSRGLKGLEGIEGLAFGEESLAVVE